MSVLMFVIDPQNDFEKHAMLPVATERFFESVWLRLVQRNSLLWVPLFQTGLDIELADLPCIIKELDIVLKSASHAGLSEDERNHLTTRASLLRERLQQLFHTRPDVKVYIG